MNSNFFKSEEIEDKIGYKFKNKELMTLSFVHSSFFNENRNLFSESNERLEFLGDAILEMIVSEFLYHEFPKISEGNLSKLRASSVDATACSRYANKLGLEPYLLLGKGEKMQGLRGRDTILSDLFEALIGAIYLDSDFAQARAFFLKHFENELKMSASLPQKNWKAELQEYAQKKYQEPPTYQVIEESGPSHDKKFRIAVIVKNETLGIGVGGSKKEAEQNAAFNALQTL